MIQVNEQYQALAYATVRDHIWRLSEAAKCIGSPFPIPDEGAIQRMPLYTDLTQVAQVAYASKLTTPDVFPSVIDPVKVRDLIWHVLRILCAKPWLPSNEPKTVTAPADFLHSPAGEMISIAYVATYPPNQIYSVKDTYNILQCDPTTLDKLIKRSGEDPEFQLHQWFPKGERRFTAPEVDYIRPSGEHSWRRRPI